MTYLYGIIIYLLAALGMYFIYLCSVYRRIDKRVEEIKLIRESKQQRQMMAKKEFYKFYMNELLEERKVKRVPRKRK